MDRLEALEAMLPDLPAAVDQRRLGERLTKTVAALSEADAQITRLSALLELTIEVEFGHSPEQLALLNEVREEALNVGADLCNANDEGSLRDATFHYQELVKGLARLDQSVRAQWRTLLAERYRPLENFGELLTSLDDVADLGRRLKECAAAAASISTTATARQLSDQIRALNQRFALLQSERGKVIGAGEVGDFLNALADRRANLSLVTQEVRNFLEANHALDRFKILAN